MKKLMPYIAGVGLLIFALAVGTIVISLSYRALGLIFPGDLFDQIIGLMLFDAAALIWFTVFVYLCESTMQYVFAFLGFMLGLGGTVGLVSIEVGISSHMLDAAEMVKPLTYVFISVAVGHVILLYARHAAAPNVNAKISLGIDKAKIVDEGQKQAEEHLAQQLPHLGAAISNRLIADVMRDLNLSTSGGRVIDLPALPVENTTPATAPGSKMPGVGFLRDWIFNRGKGARKFEQAVPSVAQHQEQVVPGAGDITFIPGDSPQSIEEHALEEAMREYKPTVNRVVHDPKDNSSRVVSSQKSGGVRADVADELSQGADVGANIQALPANRAPIGTVKEFEGGKKIKKVYDHQDADGVTVVWDGSRGYRGYFANEAGEVWVSYVQSDLDLAIRQPKDWSRNYKAERNLSDPDFMLLFS